MCVYMHVYLLICLSILSLNYTVIHRGSESEKALRSQILGLRRDFSNRIGLTSIISFSHFS